MKRLVTFLILIFSIAQTLTPIDNRNYIILSKDCQTAHFGRPLIAQTENNESDSEIQNFWDTVLSSTENFILDEIENPTFPSTFLLVYLIHLIVQLE